MWRVIFPIFLISFNFVFLNCLTTKGPVCKSRCCANYFEKDGVCTDCPLGSFGLNCNKTCVANYFGKLCQETCNCTVDEYCDTVKGCLPKQRNTSEILISSVRMISTTEQMSVKAANNTTSCTYPVSGNIMFFLSGSICTVLIAVGFIFLKSRLRNVREFCIAKISLRNNDRNYINAVQEELMDSVYNEIDGQSLGNLPDAPIHTSFSGVIDNAFNHENSDVATCCENAETSDGIIHITDTATVSDYQMASFSEPAKGGAKYVEDSANEYGNLKNNCQYSRVSLRKTLDPLKIERNDQNKEVSQDVFSFKIDCHSTESGITQTETEYEVPLTLMEIQKEHSDK